ncbi:MAG: class I adenylate-forming enzyme family protein, partial [Actinomycetota bacterium]
MTSARSVPWPDWPREPSFPDFEPTAGHLIHDLVERHAATDLVVLGDRRATYAEIEAASADLARGLLARGVGKGSRVGLLAPNGPEWITGWLAATRIGAVAVLLNTYLKARELEWVLRHSDVDTLLLADRHLGHDYLERLEEVAPALAAGRDSDGRLVLPSHPFLRSIHTWPSEGRVPPGWAGTVDDLVAAGASVPAEHLAEVEAEVDPADPMVVVYSSGSTDEPKGAIHSHGAVVRHAHNLWQFRDLAAGDVVYTPMPLFWIGGLSFTLLAAMHAGATLVFEERFEPGATLDLLERERVTIAIGWPHMSKALTEHPTFPERDLSAIKGGSFDALLPEDQRPADPSLRVNSLGMTETCGPHLLGVMGSELPESKRGSFGLSAPGLEHRVVDPVTGDELPPGEMGELWVRGYSVMLGLHRRERSEVFTPDGWYPTGDGGWFDEDGHFYFKGRMGEQIKASGMNVTPREVELVLEEMAEVMHAFVLGVSGG